MTSQHRSARVLGKSNIYLRRAVENCRRTLIGGGRRARLDAIN